MVIFAIRLAAGNCRGSRKPSVDQIHKLLQKIGEFYRGYSVGKSGLLEFTFANEALHSNKVDSNLDQGIESIWKRFEQHDVALVRKVGFDAANAIYLTMGLMVTMTRRLESLKKPKEIKLTKAQRYDYTFFVRPDERVAQAWRSAITFDTKALESLFPPHMKEKVARYIGLTSVPLQKILPIRDPLDDDSLFEFPIISTGETYIIPIPHYLMYGLTLRLHRELKDDPGYRAQYLGKKGGILEEWASEELRLLLNPCEVIRRRKYRDNGGRAEADIIISFGEYLLFIECTTKWIDVDTWRGQTEDVHDVLAESIRKCYRQALRAKRAYLDGRLDLKLQKKPSVVLTMVVTDTLYPNLMYEHATATQRHLTSYISRMVEGGEYPYILNIYDLETLHRITNGQMFMLFVAERLWMYEHPFFLAHDEFDYFILFSKKEYSELKEKVLQKGIIMNYVAHLQPPVFLSPLFLECFDILGSDRSAVIEPKAKYSKELVTGTLAILYELYNTWRATKHLVFDSKGYGDVVSEYRKDGRKCRALVWEGLHEYIDYCRIIGRSDEAELLQRKLDTGGFAEDVGILIVLPTDIYREAYRRAKEEGVLT